MAAHRIDNGRPARYNDKKRRNEATNMNRLKVLAIGNSFSQNAMTHLHRLADADGVWITTVNLMIGGCTLERHANNIRRDARDYTWQFNGIGSRIPLSVREGLLTEKWDVVTMQQASGYSGLWDSYAPYIGELSEYVRHYAPQAEQRVHQTWAYELDAPHAHFAFYGRSQKKMYDMLTDCYRRMSETIGAPIIPSGKVIQTLREETPAFDYAHGGLSLNADGFHLTQGYGCYAAGLTWYAALTGRDARKNRYSPAPDCDPAALAAIRETVARVVG